MVSSEITLKATGLNVVEWNEEKFLFKMGEIAEHF